jgi:Domain of unknown function (DUF1877)
VSLGVHFALSTQDEARLLAAAGDDDAVIGIVEQIEEGSVPGPHCDSDKAWDALHRCLTDGKLEYANGTYPLRAAVLGGRQLVEDAEYTVSYVSADQVRDVAEALSVIEEDWLRRRYDTLGDTDYAGPMDEDDFEYTWDALEDIREFFAVAAEAGQAVIFTVDA